MPTRTQTYSVDDWQLWTYVPVAGRFVLDFSKLNGADTLGSVDGSMQIQDAQIASVSVYEGSGINQGIFTEPQPASMNCSIIVQNFTSTVSKNYYLGAPIWLTLKNAETYNDSVFLKNTPIFMGRIRSFNVQLQPGSNIATITLEATSETQDDLNVLLTILKDNIVYKTVAISDAATANDIPNLFKSSNLHFGGTALGAYETKTYGEYVRDMVLGDLYVCRDDVTPTEVIWGATSRTYKYNTGIKTTDNKIDALPLYTFDKDNISNLVLDWDGLSAPTGVSLTSYFDPSVIYQYGISAASSSGANNFSATLDVKDIGELTSVGQLMVFYNKTFAPISFTTTVAQNYQNVTCREDTIVDTGLTNRSAWLYPEKLLRIGDVAQVNMPTYGFTNYQALVVGRTIEISNEYVQTTYNLWKGF